ncbi:MAG TPA: hypothetical protein VHT31_04340 [Candidatus Acidoferrum sp.]|jgi:hypothetical protein|nr:hypothetical protein [Candidatus Acidoferrum sp.]
MAHIYMHFDFGADEEKAQEARHKLDVWKQAFRLDKKLQYKLDRPEDADADEEDSAGAEGEAGVQATEKAKSKSKSKSGKKAGHAEGDSEDNGTGNVSLLVRLYFSSHEKLSEQRWLDRIPTEEPFKSASPKVLRQGDTGFEEALKQFSDLD